VETTQISEILQLEDSPILRFRRALRRSDQMVFDDLFLRIREHVAAIRVTDRASTFETILLAMLLEEHKEVTRLRRLIEDDFSFDCRE
jgi:hypothetical protein